MDNDDRKDIEQHFTITNENNHKIIKNMNQQIKINNNFNKTFNYGINCFLIIICIVILLYLYCKHKKVKFNIINRIQENPKTGKGGVTYPTIKRHEIAELAPKLQINNN